MLVCDEDTCGWCARTDGQLCALVAKLELRIERLENMLDASRDDGR